MVKKTAITRLLSIMLMVIIGIGVFGPASIWGQDKFPDDPITFIVNYGAGGTSDTLSRALAKPMENELGQAVNVRNKSGGGGTVGVAAVANAKPDGYSIGSLSMAPLAIKPNEMDLPYEIDDFEFLGAYGMWTYGIGVNADSPYKSIEDLVKAARENPGKITFTNTGFPNALAILGIEKAEGVNFSFVRANSGAEAARDVAGGHLDIVVQSRGELEAFVEEGRIRMLASASDERLDFIPDVPTLKELGYDIAIKSYIGVGVPAGVPEDRLEILRDAFEKAIKDEKVQTIIKRQGLVPVEILGDDYKEFLKVNKKEFGKAFEELDM